MEKFLHKWQLLVTELQAGKCITIPRYYCYGIIEEINSYEIHGFCDASASAYAAVVYTVIRTTMGGFVRFIASKTRVAPTQTQTIPRLELLSALLLARLITSISTSLNFQLTLRPPRSYMDSKIALFWI